MTRQLKPVGHPLFQRVLAEDWEALPTPVRNMHTINRRQAATGSASVERGSGTAANMIAWIFGFPQAASSTPVTVTFERDGTGEIWTRRFGNSAFTTRLDQPSGRNAGIPIVTESFGALAFDLGLHLDNERLYLNPVAWRLFNIALPIALAPHGTSYEFVEDGVFAFHIEVRIPIVGLIVRYRGKLDTVSKQDQA